MLKFPNIDLNKQYPNARAEIRAIESYIYQLVEELRFRFGENPDTNNSEVTAMATTGQETGTDDAALKSTVELTRVSNLILNISDISETKNITLRTIHARYGDKSTFSITLDETTGLLDVNTSGLYRISCIVTASTPQDLAGAEFVLTATDENGSRELLSARRPDGSSNSCSTSLGTTVVYLYAGAKLALTLNVDTAGRYTIEGGKTRILIEQLY